MRINTRLIYWFAFYCYYFDLFICNCMLLLKSVTKFYVNCDEA